MNKTKLRIFPTIPRNLAATGYVDQLMRLARFGDRNGFAGVLLFAGNDTPIEPWSMAQHILAHTETSSPLVAVNPAYMHPFTAAKFIASFAQLHARKIFLNMITGTATSDLQGLGEQLSHHDRYSRLSEFIHILRQLLAGTRPVSFKGQFYTTDNLQLRQRVAAELMPEFLIAGQSDDAKRVAKETGCLMMQMLPPNLEEGLSSRGINLGIFARETDDQARREARLFFEDSAEKRELLKYSLENTDSVWKRRLEAAGQTSEIGENGYWLLPFLTFEADCPYLVGSYAEIGVKLRRFADMKIDTIILDVVANEQELEHVRKALASGGVI
jgi:alkanesulfonate monooxygenase